ncbi:hemerythrin domain-containing protein [Cupriavidus oxalaticus]|uniref:hemerythrin domain-containing protein n=1 Tax=Cupriavidus oxalaticus TaxID=96344 RepID=UPI00317A1D82
MSDVIDTLVQQHRSCDAALARLEGALREADWTQAAAAFAELEAALDGNFGAEEARLFPAFEQATGMAGGPTAVMRHEHDEVRALMDNVREWLSLRDANALAAETDTLVVLLQQHNLKEENVLFPMCRAHVPGLDAVLDGIA